MLLTTVWWLDWSHHRGDVVGSSQSTTNLAIATTLQKFKIQKCNKKNMNIFDVVGIKLCCAVAIVVDFAIIHII